ncbi:diaminopimelate decarboxylase [Bacillaceae bacterium SIJ1]|uniref:diaminopimelate decarboxylase n=1 Tax=Litoribacterium kuwaitense TaxID=1398745 RepID=UPI0013EDC0D1|nr:diaminopimelate decarboxylase [Litoribacterium kuwaitense]NGP43654.1 diaminopimelate decarboxylase [Litoribacterium kuwaitense]
MEQFQHTNERGHLLIGGMDAIDLAEEYQTPLIAYDVNEIRAQAARMHKAFQKRDLSYQIAYASKAFSCVAMVQLAMEEKLSLDVVSAGELYTALKAGYPAENIHFHGNNKSHEELTMAVDAGIGCVVVDNFYELTLLDGICEEKKRAVSVLLRVTPGIEAHTHEYILTGQEDSKFGFDIMSGQADKALEFTLHSEHLNWLGVHSHIGSQIFEPDGFFLATDKVVGLLSRWKDIYGKNPAVLNIGGGFGIRYTNEDTPLEVDQLLGNVLDHLLDRVNAAQMEIPEIWIEPGRALVGEAATTLYTIGSRKDIPGVRSYVSVDGGMSDNLRPALYQAKYEACLAKRPTAPAEEVVSIAGKCCETGDMLIWDASLPKSEAGDVLAVPSTGAYGYAMANHYNRIPRPAVVFVEGEEAKVVIRRETLDDLIRLDEPWTSEQKHSAISNKKEIKSI